MAQLYVTYCASRRYCTTTSSLLPAPASPAAPASPTASGARTTDTTAASAAVVESRTERGAPDLSFEIGEE